MRIKSHAERNPIKLSQVSTNAAVNTHAHLRVGDVIGCIKLENIKSFSFRDGETALCAEIRSINVFFLLKFIGVLSSHICGNDSEKTYLSGEFYQYLVFLFHCSILL